MLFNCPRCGLSQPDDQYCAQCGVNMHSFKQKEKPLWVRLASNTSLQIGLLILVTFFIGQSLFRNQEPINWFKQITHFQGISKSMTLKDSKTSSLDALNADQNISENLENTNNENQNDNFDKSENFEMNQAATSGATPASALAQANSSNSSSEAQNLSAINFKISYAEIKTGVLERWVQDSISQGLYQNLTNYSAGILMNFKNRQDSQLQNLKTVDFKLSPGKADSNLSGVLSPDGNQMTGLVTSLEFRISENEVIYGDINVTKSSSQSTENYPAEFALPKGAVFFIIGAIKRENFTSDKAKLNMPPFQIFKSADFMTHKTEFVIIVEPIYN